MTVKMKPQLEIDATMVKDSFHLNIIIYTYILVHRAS